MADYSAYHRGPGHILFPNNAPNQHRTHPARARTPTASNRTLFNPDAPSPSRSPARQSSHSMNMYNQGHGHQGHAGMLNGRPGHHAYMPMGLNKQFQQHAQNAQHQSHGHQPHQDHAAGAHGGQYNHQHNLSGGALSTAQPHFPAAHLQNSTPSSVHSALTKAPNPHWAEQLQLAQQAREMNQSHAHARNHPSVNKNVIAGTANGASDENSKDELRNRPANDNVETTKEKHPWTTLDFGGQNLKIVTPPLFQYYTFLTKLYLNFNKLTFLPSAIGKLRSLVHLDLSLNDLRFLPSEIGMLVNLKELLLFDNQLETLPFEMGSLYKLEMLGIEGNPITEDIKSIIVEQGTKELIKYFRENAQGPEPPPERPWHSLEEEVDTGSETVTALSYNILCDKYCTQAQYGYTPEAALTWEHRRETILAELRDRNADIVCLQEIDQDSFNNFFRGRLAQKPTYYKGVFWPKSRARTMDEANANMVDGCAIFFRATKYHCHDKQLVNFSQTAINRPDMKDQQNIFNRVMPRDDIAVVAFLENLETGTRFIVGNVHVFWNPDYTDVKTVQVAILLEALTKYAERYVKWPPLTEKEKFRFTNGEDGEDEVPPVKPAPSQKYSDATQIPLLLCGDFNSLPNSGICHLITHGSLESSHDAFGGRGYGNFTKEGIRHPFKLKSSYSAIGELAFTNYTPNFVGVLDYIWYSANTLQVAGLLGDVDKDYLQRVPGFPNYHFPSDHLALYAKYLVKPRKDKKESETERERDRERRA
ncbi:hypothetical protein M011DRAFT_496791 [Sporormia fimetaria CBS 119925]|uniref:CCR4-Not complex 3'-5'-exoribonuclease subunit Ccr4 n=1 Tax=Sporormia fimetaria CBS 119925 TaxID=1340428 RepID=A0A6A6UZH2_9PLEO|nr:hypothetical protein M011DRAFT_496791 [Sporormia fimetaria CBS 119925]